MAYNCCMAANGGLDQSELKKYPGYLLARSRFMAFRTFEGLRRARVESVLTESRRTGARKAPAHWLGRRIRDLVLPVFLRNGAKATEWMYAFPVDWPARVLPVAT